MIKIRQATNDDHDAIWGIIEPVIRKGDTYAFSPHATCDEMLLEWCGSDTVAYVACLDQKVVGTFMMKRNQPGLGSHVANAGFMVAPQYAGLGVGRKMGEYSLSEARRLGFRAMQFNMVVSTNLAAIRLWERLGFEVVGEVPEAFHQQRKGYVSVYIMHRLL